MVKKIRQIIIEGLKLERQPSAGAQARENGLSLEIEAGRLTVLLGWSGKMRASLLRVLAGLERPIKGRFYVADSAGENRDGSSDPGVTVAYLPPPGEEIFTGTTVGEELAFYGLAANDREDSLSSLEQRIGFSFSTSTERSVWELSDSERRGLLLVSQALVSPDFWVCAEPDALFDGRRRQGVKSLLRAEAGRGAVVLLSVSAAGAAFDWAERLAVLDESGAVLFQGEPGNITPEAAAAVGWNTGVFNAARPA